MAAGPFLVAQVEAAGLQLAAEALAEAEQLVVCAAGHVDARLELLVGQVFLHEEAEA